MPYDDPEPDDQHLLVGVRLPGDESATREMAAAFADEFAQMGFDRDRLLRLFANPFYAGADGFTLHAATRAGALDAAGREALLRYAASSHRAGAARAA